MDLSSHFSAGSYETLGAARFAGVLPFFFLAFFFFGGGIDANGFYDVTAGFLGIEVCLAS